MRTDRGAYSDGGLQHAESGFGGHSSLYADKPDTSTGALYERFLRRLITGAYHENQTPTASRLRWCVLHLLAIRILTLELLLMGLRYERVLHLKWG